MSDSANKHILLSGLDGSNPLAFLAALGVLATLDRGNNIDNPKMDWILDSGAWRPRLYAGVDSTHTLIEHLSVGLHESETLSKQVWEANDRLPYSARDFRALCDKLASESHISSRIAVDLVAALGVDVLADKNEKFTETALRLVRSGDSGGKGMLAYSAWIIRNTTDVHLQQLFSEYVDLNKGTSLRWDPAELRTRALQWGDPSKEEVLSRRGLNRVALEALPLFATVPVGIRAVTVGFSRLRGQQGQAFSWPIWTDSLPFNVIRSLLTLDTLSNAVPDSRSLATRGVAAVFRCMRFPSSQYYSNFTPAMAV